MKKLYLLFFLLAITTLSSCVDVEEEFDFHADGSCNVNYNFDMSKAISVLINLMPDSVKETPQFNISKDTTINFYNILPDSAYQKMDSSQVVMNKNSDLVIRMNLKSYLMDVSLLHSADNLADLNYYLKNLSKMTSDEKLSAIMQTNSSLKDVKSNQLMIGQDYYTYDIGPHKFYRTVDKDKFKKYIKLNEPVFNMSKAMLIDMPYKIVLNFPDPIKRTGNDKAVLSADKRSVIIETNIDEAYKNPDVMGFKIDF